MKFSTSVRQFQETVNKVMQAIPAKALDPRYENLHLQLQTESLTLFASDGEMSITADTKVESEQQGEFAMKARTILDFLRSMYDTPVSFSVESIDGNQGMVDIATDKGMYKIPCTFDSRSAKEQREYDIELSLPANDMSDIIHKTIFACSVDGMRPAMMGVLFEIESDKIIAVSTDGHRLVRCIKPCESGLVEKKKIVIPARVLSSLLKLTGSDDEVKISVSTSAKTIRFAMEGIIMDAALIVEQYPNYEAVIPLDNDKTLTINRSQFYDSVKRVGRFSSIGDIRISVTATELTLMAENTNEGESAHESIPCAFEGDDITIGFNSKFIEAALAHIETDSVTMDMSSPTTAVIIKPETDKENGSLIILVMPVRINN